MAVWWHDVQNPTVSYGCSECHGGTTLARVTGNGPMAKYVPVSPSRLRQIEPSFIHKNVFIRSFHGIQVNHSLYLEMDMVL